MKRRVTRCRRFLLNLRFSRLSSEFLFEPEEVNGPGGGAMVDDPVSYSPSNSHFQSLTTGLAVSSTHPSL